MREGVRKIKGGTEEGKKEEKGEIKNRLYTLHKPNSK